MIEGQRGKNLLVIDGYTLAKNNAKGSVAYWNCRYKNSQNVYCRARARTVQKTNGLYTIIITCGHNHPPTPTLTKKLEAFVVKKQDIGRSLKFCDDQHR